MLFTLVHIQVASWRWYCTHLLYCAVSRLCYLKASLQTERNVYRKWCDTHSGIIVISIPTARGICRNVWFVMIQINVHMQVPYFLCINYSLRKQARWTILVLLDVFCLRMRCAKGTNMKILLFVFMRQNGRARRRSCFCDSAIWRCLLGPKQCVCGRAQILVDMHDCFLCAAMLASALASPNMN